MIDLFEYLLKCQTHGLLENGFILISLENSQIEYFKSYDEFIREDELNWYFKTGYVISSDFHCQDVLCFLSDDYEYNAEDCILVVYWNRKSR